MERLFTAGLPGSQGTNAAHEHTVARVSTSPSQNQETLTQITDFSGRIEAARPGNLSSDNFAEDGKHPGQTGLHGKNATSRLFYDQDPIFPCLERWKLSN